MRARGVAGLTALAGLVAATVPAVLGAGPATGVTTDQTYWVPVDKQIVVRGHGYGHGHGMSQYGAQGAAQEGKSYKDIVDFYYPGTSWSQVRGKVRVLISADTSDDVVVGVADGLSVRDLGTRAAYQLPVRPAIKQWRLTVRDKKTVVEKYTDRWRRFRPGGNVALSGDGEFFARTPIRLSTPSGWRTYRGVLRAARPSSGSTARDTVNVLTMDQYVMGVVPYEMPASWHPEAVKAQSIAARTYATYSRAQYPSRYYQICDTTACQVYGGVSAEDARSNRAVRATARQILTYDGKAAFTQFSSSSGGWTSRGSVPYLPAKEDPYDGWAGNPVHSWTTKVDAARLERRYPKIGTLTRIEVTTRDGNGEWQGRVGTLVLRGSTGSATMTGDDFRWAVGLRSTWFTIDPTPIMNRWQRIGGTKSPLGTVRGAEYPVRSGSAQRFERGRIFYSRPTGPRELYGPVLRRYQKAGGPSSRLGLPKTAVRPKRAGTRALFVGGGIYSLERIGTVLVSGPVAKRYVTEGELRSGLGWPTGTNRAVRDGERVDFEHGYIRWFRSSGKTVVRRNR
jgi:SpoIID/LytB domain protein